MIGHDALSPYLTVYRVLEETAFAGNVAPGSRGALYGAIDGLIALDAPREHVELAGAVSLALHRLWLARSEADASTVDQAEAMLRAVSAAWLQTPMHLGSC